MDIATSLFVGILCLVAFFLTATIRREFLAEENQRREQETRSRRLRHKPEPPAAYPQATRTEGEVPRLKGHTTGTKTEVTTR